jgi:succinoglycan biosynthesis transport protein ExoP
VNQDAAEALFGALRRAIPLILICTITTATALNVQRQLAGPVYSASADVYLSTRDLASILTNTQAQYVDPQRASENAVALARSTALFQEVAKRNPRLGGADQIESQVVVTADPNSDVLTFTATAAKAQLATATANAMAYQYVTFRSTVSGVSTDQAITKLEKLLATNPSNKAEVTRLLQRLELQKTLNSGDAIVIDPAKGASKVAPAPVRDTVLGVAIGLVLALMISGVREVVSTRVRSEADIENILGHQVTTLIPRLPKSTTIVAIGRHEAKYGDTYALLAASIEQESREADGGDMRTRVIAVTSAVAGEGKTTTAVNLGIAMAKRGLRVALVDFDLRKPQLGHVFRLPPHSEGVMQVVDSDRPVESFMWSYPISGADSAAYRLPQGRRAGIGTATRIPLVVVPAGGSDRSGVVARSPRAVRLIETLREDADVVIVDTPPALLAAEMAELSGAADGVIVVVRYGGPTRRDLTQLARQASTWKAPIQGVVLTAAPASTERQQYYYRD